MLSVSDPYPFDCLNFPAVSPESVNLCHLRFVCISAVHATQMVWHLCCFLFDRNPVVSNIASIIITIPLLVLVIRFVSPYIIRLKYESRTTLLLFFLLPLVYYVLEYTFTVYTDLLYTGGAVVIDFMDSFLVVSFFILSVLSLKFSSEKIKQNGKIFCLLRLPHRHRKKLPSFPLPSSRQPFTGMTCDTI